MAERRQAVIFDRDGTLASCQRHLVDGSQGHSDWEEFNAWLPFDAVVPETAALFKLLRRTTDLALIVTTGRKDNLRFQMSAWLEKHGLLPDRLLMRGAHDNRVDSVVKLELFRRFIEPEFDVQLVVDDRPQVVEMWRSIGLPVLAVTDPGVRPPLLDGVNPTAVRSLHHPNEGGASWQNLVFRSWSARPSPRATTPG